MIELLIMPLLMLNNLTLDDFSTSAEWGESTDMLGSQYYYRWDDSRHTKEQYREIYYQSYWGLPEDVVFQSGVGPVQWFYLHTTGPRYELYYENQTYSNSSELRIISGYLQQPRRFDDGRSINRVTFTPVEYQQINDDIILKTTATVNWQVLSGRASPTGPKTRHYTSTKDLYHTYKNIPLMWPDTEAYNQVIPVTVTNHSSTYTTININIPDGCSQYTINAVSENNTAHYIKTNYVYHKLDDNCYYMESLETLDHTGMRPFGKNTFILPPGEYDVKMYASSPFEKVELDLNVSHIDEHREKRELNKDYFIALLTLIITGLVMKRYYGSY